MLGRTDSRRRLLFLLGVFGITTFALIARLAYWQVLSRDRLTSQALAQTTVTLDMPSNTFYCHASSNLVLFVGKEPNLHWRAFGDCILELAKRVGISRILFVGSFGGPVPHTRQPRLYVTRSEAPIAGCRCRPNSSKDWPCS
jgi:hypothetical protein